LTSEDVKAVATNSRRSLSSRNRKNSCSESFVAPVRLVDAQAADAGFTFKTESGNALESTSESAPLAFLLADGNRGASVAAGVGESERFFCGAPLDNRLDKRSEESGFAGPRQFSSELGNSLLALADPNESVRAC
jgi:hypothetical protein